MNLIGLLNKPKPIPKKIADMDNVNLKLNENKLSSSSGIRNEIVTSSKDDGVLAEKLMNELTTVDGSVLQKKDLKRKKKDTSATQNTTMISTSKFDMEEYDEFGNLKERLPNKEEIKLKTDNFYMNNRQIFIKFVNHLFSDYKQDLENENKKQITCEDISNNTSMSLLTHQKIVRDYINLHTPYRGLLLYHGLGAGKTCTSIAIAEGLKERKKIIVMTPKSLKQNYIDELKKCGDLLYRKNQYWEWITVEVDGKIKQTRVTILHNILNLPEKYITKNKGAWLVNITKQPNYDTLTTDDKNSLEKQIDIMILQKYEFIHYNGLRKQKWLELTNNLQHNIFSNNVVIIDEAHNLISRIVNKISTSPIYNNTNKEDNINFWDEIANNKTNELALMIYEALVSATNTRIILLSGTPIINYSNEIAVIFNILRGSIRSWQFKLSPHNTTGNNAQLALLTLEKIKKNIGKDPLIDYIDYMPSTKILTVTRNPFGFRTSNNSDEYSGVNDKGYLTKPVFTELSDKQFIHGIMNDLMKSGIKADPLYSKSHDVGKSFLALPHTMDSFVRMFIDDSSTNDGVKLKNKQKFQKRIIGLTSYFRSAQEEMLPHYDPKTDKHIVRVQMSDEQFKKYEEYRHEERDKEKKSKQQNNAEAGVKGILKEKVASTYRIFSRLSCNFVFPDGIIRPMPSQFRKKFDAEKEELKMDERQKIVDKIPKFGYQDDDNDDNDDISIQNQFEQSTNKLENTSTLLINNDEIDDGASIASNDSYIVEVVSSANQDFLGNVDMNTENKKMDVSDDVLLKKMSSSKDSDYDDDNDDYNDAISQKTETTIGYKYGEENGDDEDSIYDLDDIDNLEDIDEKAQESQEGGEVTFEELDKNNVESALKTNEETDEEIGNDDDEDDPLAKITDITYQKGIKMAMEQIKQRKSEIFSEEGLLKWSPKFLKMLENINKTEGLNLIYSQFRALEGLGLFAIALEANGYSEFKLNRQEDNTWDIDVSKMIRGKCFAFYTGTETDEEKRIILNIYNGNWNEIPNNIAEKLRRINGNNYMGEIIKILMITSAGAEGINLRNTRYVHIMEPYWHNVRLDQVIGRARRICSHSALEEKYRTVEVYIYITQLTKKQIEAPSSNELRLRDRSRLSDIPISSDDFLFEVATVKEKVNTQILMAVKETSIDCATYSKINKENLLCLNFGNPSVNDWAYKPNYENDDNDKMVQINKEKVGIKGVKFEHNGVTYIRDVDTNQIYDYDSIQTKNPLLVGKLVKEINKKTGKMGYKFVKTF